MSRVPIDPVRVMLPVRAPFAADAMLAFLAARCIPGVEQVLGRTYSRTLRLPHGPGTAHLAFPLDGRPAEVAATLRLSDSADLATATERCRRLLDADARPAEVDAVLTGDSALAAAVRGTPGLRVPGAVDGPEILVRAMLGQQISVAAARTTAARLTLAADNRLTVPDGGLTHLFPSADSLAELGPTVIGGPRPRARALTCAAAALADGSLVIDVSRTSSDLIADLVTRPGIGPWTAGYVAMRVLGDHDVLLTGDLALRNGAASLGLPAQPKALTEHSERWRPYRSYAGMHLWRAATAVAVRPR